MPRFIAPLGHTPETKNIRSSGNFTIDAIADIVLDADGDEVIFKDGSISVGHVSMDSDNLTIKSLVSDKDIILQGNDGGSAITAITVDMSAAGKATFNNEIVSGAVITSGAGLLIANNGTIGSASDTDAIAIASDGVVTMNQIPVFSAGINVSGGTIAGTLATAAQTNITSLGTLTTLTVDNIIINGTNIGHTSDTDSIAIASDGVVTFSQIPVLPANSIDSDYYVDGSIDTAHIADNQITLAKMAGIARGKIIVGDASGDPAVLAPGTNGQVLTSDGTDLSFSSLAADNLAAGDAAVNITTSSGNITIDAAANDSDIILKGTDGGADTDFLTIDGSAAGKATFNNEIVSGAVITSGAGLVIADDGTIGSASDTDAIAIAANGVVTFSAGIAGTLTTAAQTNITSVGTLTALTVDDVVINGKVLTITGDTSDTFTITTGAAGATTLATTDAAGTGGNLTLDADGLLTLDSGDTYGTINLKYQGTLFGVIYSAEGAGQAKNLVIRPDVDDSDIIFKGKDGGAFITALTLDMSEAGKATFNNEIVSGAVITSGAGLVIADAGTIGSASDTDAIAIAADGVVTMNQIPVFSAGINVSGGTIAGTLATAAQTNITSLGTLTALTVDDVVINGKVITITGDTDDTFTITTGAAGATTIATVDTAGADGILTLDADGIIKLDAGDASGQIRLLGGGTQYGTIFHSGSGANLNIKSIVSDGDINFVGNDGGADVTALTLDMSAAGKATFNDDVVVGDDILLQSDGSRLFFGAGDDVILTHIHNSGLRVTRSSSSDDQPVVFQLKSLEGALIADEVIGSLEFAAGDTDGTDGATVAAGIHAIAEDTFSASANKTKLVFTTGVSETAASSATAKATLSSIGDFTVAGDLIIKDGGTIGSASDLDAIAIAADGVATFSQAPVFPDGSIAVADLDIDGAADIGAALVDADLFIVDDGAGGANRKSTMARIKTYINASASGSVNADDIAGGDAAVTITTSSGDITIDAAANDSDIILKGTDGGADTTFLTIDGSAAGEATFNAGIVIADAGNIGSASDKDAIAIASGGVVTFSQAPVFSNGWHVGGTGAANKLDDFEVGNFTAGLAPQTSGSITLVTGGRPHGIYQKIGNMVFVQGLVFISSVSSPQGELHFTGLPFTVAAWGDSNETIYRKGTINFYFGFLASNVEADVIGRPWAETTYARVTQTFNTTNTVQDTFAQLIDSGTAYFQFSGSYPVSTWSD